MDIDSDDVKCGDYPVPALKPPEKECSFGKYGLLPEDMIAVSSVLIIDIVFYVLYAAMSYGLIELKLHLQRRAVIHGV